MFLSLGCNLASLLIPSYKFDSQAWEKAKRVTANTSPAIRTRLSSLECVTLMISLYLFLYDFWPTLCGEGKENWQKGVDNTDERT